MDQPNEPELPEGVSRWVFIVPGALIGGVIGALPGVWASYIFAAVLIDALGVPSADGRLWLVCWIWCVMTMMAVGGYLGYWIWRTDDRPRR